MELVSVAAVMTLVVVQGVEAAAVLSLGYCIVTENLGVGYTPDDCNSADPKITYEIK